MKSFKKTPLNIQDFVFFKELNGNIAFGTVTKIIGTMATLSLFNDSHFPSQILMLVDDLYKVDDFITHANTLVTLPIGINVPPSPPQKGNDCTCNIMSNSESNKYFHEETCPRFVSV